MNKITINRQDVELVTKCFSVYKTNHKQTGCGTSNQMLFCLQGKFRKIPLLVIHYLNKCDDIIQNSFWIIPKIASANLCKPYILLNLESVERKE